MIIFDSGVVSFSLSLYVSGDFRGSRDAVFENRFSLVVEIVYHTKSRSALLGITRISRGKEDRHVTLPFGTNVLLLSDCSMTTGRAPVDVRRGEGPHAGIFVPGGDCPGRRRERASLTYWTRPCISNFLICILELRVRGCSWTARSGYPVHVPTHQVCWVPSGSSLRFQLRRPVLQR